jgi:hypothetical protein
MVIRLNGRCAHHLRPPVDSIQGMQALAAEAARLVKASTKSDNAKPGGWRSITSQSRLLSESGVRVLGSSHFNLSWV